MSNQPNIARPGAVSDVRELVASIKRIPLDEYGRGQWPTSFRLLSCHDVRALKEAVTDVTDVEVVDTIVDQLRALARLRNRARKLTPCHELAFIDGLLGRRSLSEYGQWAYYPRPRKLVHLPEDEHLKELRAHHLEPLLVG